MDDLLTLKQAAERVPGGKVADVTLWRWIRQGMKTQSGEVVRLRHAAAGRRMLVSESMLREFFEALGGQDSADSHPCRCAR